MPGKLKIQLTELEKEKLLEIIHNPKIPKRTRFWSEILILNARGWDVKEIKDWIKLAPNTIRKTLSEWIVKGEQMLWDKPRTPKKEKMPWSRYQVFRRKMWKSGALSAVEAKKEHIIVSNYLKYC